MEAQLSGSGGTKKKPKNILEFARWKKKLRLILEGDHGPSNDHFNGKTDIFQVACVLGRFVIKKIVQLHNELVGACMEAHEFIESRRADIDKEPLHRREEVTEESMHRTDGTATGSMRYQLQEAGLSGRWYLARNKED